MYSGSNETAKDKQDTNDGPYDFDSLRAMAHYHNSDPTINEAINEYIDDSDLTKDFDDKDVRVGHESDPIAWQSECLEVIRHEKNVILSSPTGSGKTKVF